MLFKPIVFPRKMEWLHNKILLKIYLITSITSLYFNTYHNDVLTIRAYP